MFADGYGRLPRFALVRGGWYMVNGAETVSSVDDNPVFAFIVFSFLSASPLQSGLTADAAHTHTVQACMVVRAAQYSARSSTGEFSVRPACCSRVVQALLVLSCYLVLGFASRGFASRAVASEACVA